MTDTNEAVIELATNLLIRLALLNERTKRFLKREDIIKVCIPECPRHFNELIEATNVKLANIFGMSLVPVYSSKKVNLQATSNHISTSQSRRRAVEQAKNKTVSGYVLVSTLTKEEKGDISEERPQSLLIEIGFMSMVLCFVKLSGGQINLEDLVKHLEVFYKEDQLACIGRTVHVLLDALCKQKYITIFNHADGEKVMWGARAEVEFKKEDITAFLVDLYKQSTSNEDDVHRLQERLSATTI